MIQFKKLDENAIIPTIANPLDAGLDIYALESKRIWAGEQECFKTGIACAIPEGYVGIIKPRSGLSVRHCIDTKAGVIDASYRGELVVVLRNDSTRPKDFDIGDRIAQMIVIPVMTECCEVDELDFTERGKSGFGSSGS